MSNTGPERQEQVYAKAFAGAETAPIRTFFARLGILLIFMAGCAGLVALALAVIIAATLGPSMVLEASPAVRDGLGIAAALALVILSLAGFWSEYRLWSTQRPPRLPMFWGTRIWWTAYLTRAKVWHHNERGRRSNRTQYWTQKLFRHNNLALRLIFTFVVQPVAFLVVLMVVVWLIYVSVPVVIAALHYVGIGGSRNPY
jgi:hypothetical protein